MARSVEGNAKGAAGNGSARNKALNTLSAYANGSTLVEAGSKSVNAGNLQDATAASGVRVSSSIGASSSTSNTLAISDTARGSLVKAGGNVTVQTSEESLAVQGSTLSADKSMTLNAARDLNLLASIDTQSSRSHNTSSSASVGVSVGMGSKGVGASLDLAASHGKGQGNSDSTAYNNTHVDANDTLTLTSGNDTNLKGTVVSGQQLIANVTGNLNAESMQDISTSKANQINTGITVSIPIYGTGNGNVSFSQARQNSSSDYASVYEQTSLNAGNGGFRIVVNGNTNLKGAILSSTGDGNLNSLSTRTLSTSNIENRMTASASTRGISLGTDMLNGTYASAKGLTGNLMNGSNKSISDASSTQSGISSGKITITDEAQQRELTGKNTQETLATLLRDTTKAHRALYEADVLSMQQQVQQQQADNMLLFNTAVALADDGIRKMSAPQLFEVFCLQEPCRNDQKANNKKIGEIAMDIFTQDLSVSPETATEIAIEKISGKNSNSEGAENAYSDSDPNRRIEIKDSGQNIKNIQAIPINISDLESLPNDQKKNSTVFANGIFNDKQRAAELAIQQTPSLNPNDPTELHRIQETGSTAIGRTYLVHTDKANSFIGELIVAGVEKTAEILGVTTPASFIKADAIQALSKNVQTGKTDNSLYSVGHSRGTMTDSVAYTDLARRGFYNPNLKIIENNPAAEQLRMLERSEKITDVYNLSVWAPPNDPIPTSLVGGYNTGYYLSALRSALSIVNYNYSVHSSPGAGAVGSNSADVNKPFSYSGLTPASLNSTREQQTKNYMQNLFSLSPIAYTPTQESSTNTLRNQVQQGIENQTNFPLKIKIKKR